MSSSQALRVRALARAVELCGGTKALSHHLGIRPTALQAMLACVADVPEEAFLRVVDLLVSRDLTELSERIAAEKDGRS